MTDVAAAQLVLATPSAPALTVVKGGAATSGRPASSERRIKVPVYDLAAAQRLRGELGVGAVLAQVLVRRELADPVRAREFLAADEHHPPEGFAGLDAALELIHRHIAAGSHIVVHGDYDVDGVCATVILLRALRSLGAEASWFLPSRIDDGYGLSAATVERLAVRRTDLLITVDCAITAVEEVHAARAAGIDVVVTDHHAPRADGRLPDAPLVHPAVCGYPCPDLCGTGVAYKLACALGAPTAEDDLDLVALATVADLVPLRGENRALVRAGLRAFAATTKPGLRALLAVSRTDPSAVDAGCLGFRLAPRINAAGRLYRADAGVELLLSEDPVRARAIALELDAANAERRLVEQRLVWEAEAQVAELGERPFYVLAGEGWHPGVIGIVASRIVERHHRPTVLVALEGEEGTGSGRSIPGFDLLGALHAAAGTLARYGGHRAAAGLTVAADRVGELRAILEAHAEAVLTPELLTPVERVDAVVSASELGLDLLEDLERLEPCGMGNPAPRLLVPGARLGDVRTMGEEGRHIRFAVRSGTGHARAVMFGCDGRLPVSAEVPLDASFRLERNTWNGAEEARLVLRHAEPGPEGEIRIVGEEQDYLAAVFAELERPVGDADRPPEAVPGRIHLDRRGESPVAVLRDAVSTGTPVLAACAEVSRRLQGLRRAGGGFALVAHQTLAADRSLLEGFTHIVVLDPPSSARVAAAFAHGPGFAHWCWSDAELRFSQQMHELEFGLRTSLVALYRRLRERERVTGEELEHLLRGDGAHGRSAPLAGRLVRVLVELELVSLDRDLPALTIVSRAPTALERSSAYRAYQHRYEDGLRFLSRVNPPSSA